MRRKCGLFVPFSVPFLVGFFLLSSLLLSSFGLATTVKASSAYDNLIETTSSLEVDADCSVADITASYGQYILDDSKWDTGFLSASDEQKTQLRSSYNSREAWAITQSRDGDDAYITIWWSTEYSQSKLWWYLSAGNPTISITDDNGNGSGVAQGGNYIQIGVKNPTDTGFCVPHILGWGLLDSDSGGYSLYIASGTDGTPKPNQLFLASLDDMTLPDGYEGVIPPDTWSPSDVIRPDFTYSVDKKQITAHDYNEDLPEFTPDEGYSFQGFSVEWSLFRCNSDWSDETDSCPISTLVDHQILLQDTDYKYAVSDNDDYFLVAQYLVEQCFRYPTYPDDPDYCFYVDLGTEFDDIDFTSTTVRLKIDGSQYTGDTTQLECDSSGFCKTHTYDCSDEPDFIQRMTCEVNKQLNVGVINPSINAIKHLLTSFTVPSSPTCHIPISNVTIGHDAVFPLSDYSTQACSNANVFHETFPIVGVLLNGVFAILVISMIVRIFNKLSDHRDTDIIQGV